MPRIMMTFVAVLMLAYLGLCAILFFYQRDLIYFPQPRSPGNGETTFTLQPGESIKTHRHDHDYFFYPIEGATLEVTRTSGITQLTLNAGEVYFRKGGDTHAARNVDDHRYHEVLVELKT